MAAATALPGVYFAPPEPQAQPGLPALDVAAFVGFAERGPLHWPVAVEDLATYRDIFGGDLAVARNAQGRTLKAHLPRCVEAFFANGGRRCYVVRVAGPKARRAEFRLAGMAGLGAGGAVHLPRLQAAWPGAWANALRLSSRLRAVPLPARQFSLEAGDVLAWDSGGAPGALQTGDLLRLSVEGVRYLFPIANLIPESAHASRFLLQGAGFWRLDEALSAALPSAVEVGRAGGAEVWGGGLASESGGGVRRLVLNLTTPAAGDLRSGDILELRAGADTWLFPVEELRPPLSGTGLWQVLAAAALRPVATVPGIPSPPQPDRVERLRFDLLLRLGDEPRVIADLAFNAGHSRFFGEALLRASARPGKRAAQPVLADGGADARLYGKLQPPPETPYPRIDPVRDGQPDLALLAGILAPVAAMPGVWFLPLGMAAEAGDYRQPETVGKDGLDTFDADAAGWFVEADLVPDLDALAVAEPGQTPPYPGTARLMAEAFERVYNRDLRLRGLHGLLFVDEVALVAAPDAAHGVWPAAGGGAGMSPPPLLEEHPPVLLDLGFRECSEPMRVEGIAPGFGPTAGGTPVQLKGRGFVSGAAIVRFGGVPATAVQVAGPESLSCLTPAAMQVGTVSVTVEIDGAIAALAQGFRYALADGAALPLAADAAQFDLAASPLLAIQRELVRLCLARGDAVAIFGLPVHFEKRQCFDWLERLRPLLGWPSRGDLADELGGAADLSYAAVYHPWLLQRDAVERSGFVATPPEGAVLGMIAGSERRRMAWAAPANIPLKAPLGLAPELSAADASDLLAENFNLVRAEPRGFPAASARTLSGDQNQSQLSVRRLLILLRKTLAGLGAELVFQSNSERLQGRLRFELENLLRGFFDRGALAGSAYGEAFRVTVSGEGSELGQLIAEVRVAPSRPVEFITVRLIRTGDGVLQIGEG